MSIRHCGGIRRAASLRRAHRAGRPPAQGGVEPKESTHAWLVAAPQIRMSGDVDAFWGPSVHWNTFLNQYVMLLNHASDSDWYHEGVYVSYAPRLDDPRLWSVPAKLLDGGNWYPQVMGLEIGTGTDKVAGERARFFMSGVSQYLIHFTR